jgi:hypothetical protein
MREIRMLLRELKERGHDLASFEFRAKVDVIIRLVEEYELNDQDHTVARGDRVHGE